MSYRRFAIRDPHWIDARYPGVCASCGAPIHAGQHVWYVPATHKVACDTDGCGRQHARDIAADDFDQAQYQSQYPR